MNGVIGYTRHQLIELMLHCGIHCSVDRFSEVVATLQARAIEQNDKDREVKQPWRGMAEPS